MSCFRLSELARGHLSKIVPYHIPGPKFPFCNLALSVQSVPDLEPKFGRIRKCRAVG